MTCNSRKLRQSGALFSFPSCPSALVGHPYLLFAWQLNTLMSFQQAKRDGNLSKSMSRKARIEERFRTSRNDSIEIFHLFNCVIFNGFPPARE